MKPNILFIVIDSFQADKCFNKNKTSITPNIDFLINNGAYFSQTISTSPTTVPSFASIFTGLYPFESVIREKNIFKINPNKINYIKNLINYGYNTYATIPKLFLFIGLDKIFETKVDTYESFENLYDGVGKQILNNLSEHNFEQPWFYYLHLMDLHGTETSFLSQPPNEFSNIKFGSNRYEQMVSALDVWIGKILEKINLENTLIIFTADHGSDAASWTPEMEKFTQLNIENQKIEHGNAHKLAMRIPKSIIPFRKKLSEKYRNNRDKKIKNKIRPNIEKINELDLSPYEKRVMENAISSVPKIYEEMCHVPLIICGYNTPHKIIQQLVRSLDIFPTITEIIDLNQNDKMVDGQSLLPLINDKIIVEEPAYLESDVHSFSNNNVIGIRTSKYKYFRNEKDPSKNIHLYDLKNDLLEEKNIAKDFDNIIIEMENILKEIRNRNLKQNVDTHIDEDEMKKIEEELKKLGYV